jgi:CTP:molybdopterin cytidylyltransferase MocA
VTQLPGGPSLGGVVLAAGAARRMGGCPKPLIERDGVPLVRRVVLALIEVGVREVVVVLGHRAGDLQRVLEDLPVRCVVHGGYAAGRQSSLRAALAAMPASVDAVVVALADQALLEPADVSALLRAFAGRGTARAVVPRVNGERGHPVVLEHGVCREILQGTADVGARQWMDANPSQVAWFESQNTHYCEDVDCPADLERIARQNRCTMRWPEDP